jgi:hypothetical protein
VKCKRAIHPEFHLTDVLQELVAFSDLIMSVPYFFVPATEFNATLKMDNRLFESTEIFETLTKIKVRTGILGILDDFFGEQANITLKLV